MLRGTSVCGLCAALALACVHSASHASAASGEPIATPIRLHTDGRAVDRVREPPAPPPGPGKALTGVARLLASAIDVRSALPGMWCGIQRASDDLEHESTTDPYSFHAIYALPQGATNRFELVAGAIQEDAFQASALLERLYGRAIRFDLGTHCGPQYLDISVVHLPDRPSALADLTGQSSPLIGTMADRLRAQGFGPHPLKVSTAELAAARKNYVVWLEDVTPPGGVCGVGGEFVDARRQSDNLNNFGGQLAIIFRADGRFCNSNTVRHEIGHNLGALQPGSPNAFDGAHCDDAVEDTMCYSHAPTVSSDRYQSEFFDYGNDDYWDPPRRTLPRWTVNLSRFVCPDIACNVSTAPTNPLDAILGLVTGLLVSCPEGGVFDGKECPRNRPSDPGSEVSLVKPPRPRVVVRSRNAGRGRWRITARVTGAETGRLVIECRRGGRRVRVLSRRVTAPKTVRATVRCQRRPTGRFSPTTV